MFIKPFKIKSNNQLKGTERKKLCEDVSARFPMLTDDDIQALLSKKESINIMKIVTHNGQQVKVYCVAKIPMFFQLDSPILYPTIYTLWQHPNLLYAFTIFPGVEVKLAGGADLMLPGLALSERPTLYSFGKLVKGSPVCVNTTDNKAALAVGNAAHSSEDMYMSGGRGKCVEVLHILGDMLCQLGKPPTKPNLGPPNISTSTIPLNSNEKLIKVDETGLTESKCTNMMGNLALDNSEQADARSTTENHLEEIQHVETVDIQDADTSEPEISVDPVKEMDELLEYSFLKACKTTKPNELPMLTSNFFKNHLMAECPPDKNIDIKKSRYKKLSIFLTEMRAKGIINTSVMKGVETLLSIKYDHPLLQDLVVSKIIQQKPDQPNSVVVAECYKVTADVSPVLSKFGFQKGDVMKRADIRKCFTEYVKEENLQNGKVLKLNPQLAGIFKSKAHEVSLTMEDGINKFIGRMTRMHEVTMAGTKILHTGNLEPINMRVTVRSHNKKVTLVNNLETFGINPKEFSKECQIIGASATITEDPGKKTPSVLIQGNQILHVYKLLTEKYQIKKTYIKGLEFAPKKKK